MKLFEKERVSAGIDGGEDGTYGLPVSILRPSGNAMTLVVSDEWLRGTVNVESKVSFLAPDLVKREGKTYDSRSIHLLSCPPMRTSRSSTESTSAPCEKRDQFSFVLLSKNRSDWTHLRGPVVRHVLFDEAAVYSVESG